MVVVIEGWISSFSAGSSALAGLKTFRILRPLRVANRLPSVKMIISTLLSSLPAIADTFVVFFFFLFLFGMLCGALWSGSFTRRCVDNRSGDVVGEEELCYPQPDTRDGFCGALTFLDAPYSCEGGQTCTDFGVAPADGGLNFDNILFSILTLFAVCTMESWSGIMYITQDIMAEGTFVVFLAIIVIGNFTIINIMIASILVELGCLSDLEDEMKIEREMQQGIKDENHLKLLEMRKGMLARGEPIPPPPIGEVIGQCVNDVWQNLYTSTGKFLLMVCYSGVPSNRPENHWASVLRWKVTADTAYFSYFIQICIVFNMVCLALDDYDVSADLAFFLETANFVLTGVFCFEMAVKLIIIGMVDYFTDNWNLFDAFIVTGSVAELLLASGSSSLGVLRIVRMLRLTRVARLAKLANKWESLRTVFRRIRDSSAKMGPVLLLLVLFMFIFSILGMQMFGASVTSDDFVRFDNFYVAFVQCFYVILAEGWLDIMYVSMADTGAVSALYFVALVMIGNFVLVNLILAVVLGGAMPGEEAKRLLGVKQLFSTMNKHDLKMSLRQWRWVTTVTRTDAMMTTALVSWHHAAREYGAARFLKLAENLGLGGELLERLQTLLVELEAAGMDEMQPPDLAIAARERKRFKLLLPFHDEEAAKRRASKNRRASSVDSLSSFDQDGVGGDGELELGAGNEEVLMWKRLTKVAYLTAKFSETHVPDGMETARDGIDQPLMLVNPVSGETVLAKSAAMAASEEVEHLINASLLDKKLPPKQKLSVKFAKSDKNNTSLVVLTKDVDLVVVASAMQLRWMKWQAISKRIVATQLWTDMLFYAIIVSCLSMLFTDNDTPYLSFWFLVETICNVLFLLEVFVKIGSAAELDANYKLRTGWAGYIYEPWNRLDFLIVLSAIFSVVFRELGMTEGVNACTVVRAFRPLRMINSIDALKDQVVLLFKSFSSLGTLAVFLAFANTAYAVVGMQLLKGVYWRCDDGEYADDEDYLATVGEMPTNSPKMGVVDQVTGFYSARPCSGNFTNMDGVQLTAMGEWVNADYHFDTFESSLLSVFILSVGGWFDVVFDGLSGTEVGYTPEPYYNTNPLVIFYFFFGISFFGLYIVNEFVGVVFDTYVEEKARADDILYGDMKAEERESLDIKRRVDYVHPVKVVRRPTKPWRQKCDEFAESPSFNTFILSVIAFNGLCLTIAHDGQPQWVTDFTATIELVFSLIFTIEATIKIIGAGTNVYFSDASNNFDFTVTVVGDLDAILYLANACQQSNSTFLRLVRSMRVFRLMRLISLIKGCEVIILTCTFAWPRLVVVCQLLAILVFFFANVGVVFFEAIPKDDYGSFYCNFETEVQAMQLLFILMTGDNWNDTMGGMVGHEDVSDAIIVSYFIIYTLVMAFVIVNLFVMVVCEAFEVLNDDTKKDFERVVPIYQKAWSQFDPDARGTVAHSKMEYLIRSLPAPFGVPFPLDGDQYDTQACYKELAFRSEFVKSNLPEGDADFNEVLFLLILYRRIESGDIKGRQYTRELKFLHASMAIQAQLKVYLSRIRLRVKRKKIEEKAIRDTTLSAKSADWGSAIADRAVERSAASTATLGGPNGQPTFDVADEVML